MSDKITALTELTTPATNDPIAIVDDPTGTPITKKITVSNLVYTWITDVNANGNNLTGMGYINWNKIAAPSDPPAEEGRMYMKEIDTNNNGIFVKIQKAGAITEVQIA